MPTMLILFFRVYLECTHELHVVLGKGGAVYVRSLGAMFAAKQSDNGVVSSSIFYFNRSSLCCT